MLVAKNEGQRLVIYEREAKGALFFFGLIFILMGGIFAIFGWKTTTLNCQRFNSEINCTIEEKGLLPADIKNKNIEGLSDASIESKISRTTKSSNTVYRVILHTSQGEIPLTTHLTSDYKYKKALISEIKDNITSGADEFSIKEKERLLGVIGLVVFITGILVLINIFKNLLSPRLLCILDKKESKATFRPFYGYKKYEVIHPLYEIIDIGPLSEIHASNEWTKYMAEFYKRKGLAIPYWLKLSEKAETLMNPSPVSIDVRSRQRGHRFSQNNKTAELTIGIKIALKQNPSPILITKVYYNESINQIEETVSQIKDFLSIK